MDKITREDLFPLEKYADIRAEFRAKVLAHKKNRVVHLGPHATLYFEDRLTMLYQVQEMLRAERIFEHAGIQEELDAYNPLIPDGSNWKATFMLEFTEVEERKRQLSKLVGIEDKTWVQVNGFERVYPIADEDLERDTLDKTSAVHFVRFELNPDMVAAAKTGAAIGMGIDHQDYTHDVAKLDENIRQALAADLN